MAELSYFSWDENNAEGSQEIIIGLADGFDEINLGDDEASQLMTEWKGLLSDGQHITLRVM